MNDQKNPFDLKNIDAFKAWRDQKLESHPQAVGDLVVEIKDPDNITLAESDAMLDRIRKANMAVYATTTRKGIDTPVNIGQHFGISALDQPLLTGEDAVTALTVSCDGERRAGYIPYTTRPISWHTDGYYNELDKQIRALILHCECPAKEGGRNSLMDHEMAYLLLRDENPDYIEALMQPEVMTIPPNEESGEFIRGSRTGPIFSVINGNLHMRYTIRKRHVIWSEAPLVEQARQRLLDILHSDSPYIFEHTLESGQGLIGNNVLHTRTGFEDDDDPSKKRLMYRARYFDRINGD
ncbi:MAG: TauD/TfdA family dioxygenase [Rhodospirillales bacterium]|nr:TauD/TfdA family dioxygenase [Rhodospirillales bacterium]